MQKYYWIHNIGTAQRQNWYVVLYTGNRERIEPGVEILNGLAFAGAKHGFESYEAATFWAKGQGAEPLEVHMVQRPSA